MEGDWPYLWLDATYVKVRHRTHRLGRGEPWLWPSYDPRPSAEVRGHGDRRSEAETLEFLRSWPSARAAGVKLMISEGRRDPDPRLHLAKRACVVSAFVATAFAQVGSSAKVPKLRPTSSPT